MAESNIANFLSLILPKQIRHDRLILNYRVERTYHFSNHMKF